MDDDDFEDDSISFSGFGNAAVFEEPPKRSRCWDLKSTSRAFCEAMDRKPDQDREVGFVRRRRTPE
jgi:hypothetical protein